MFFRQMVLGMEDVMMSLFKKYCYVNKKLCNLLVNSKCNISKTTLNLDKIFFSFSNGSLSNHEKPLLCKGLNFPAPLIAFRCFFIILEC